MPTVDDLVISLTIKETGSLGKLKKEVEALTGKRMGFGKTIPNLMYLKRDLIGLKDDTNWIKKRIIFLMPTVIPRSGEKLKETARIAHSLIDTTRESLIDKMATTKELKSIMEANDIKTEEELRVFLGEKLNEYQYRLEDIMKGIWTGDKAQKFVVRLNNLISAQALKSGKAKMLLDDIENSIAEMNREIAMLLTEKGLPTVPEFTAWYPEKEKFIKKYSPLARLWSSGEFGYTWNEVENMLGLTSEKSKQTIKDMNELFFTSKNTIDFLKSASKKFGVTLSEATFDLKKIESDEILKAIAYGMVRVFAQRKASPEAGGFPKGFRDFFLNLIRLVGGTAVEKSDFSSLRIDLAIMSDDLQTLQEIFGTRLGKKIAEDPIHFIELKKLLTRLNVKQFKDYMNLFGKANVSAVASMIEASFKDLLPNIITKSMNIMDQLERAGVIEKMTPAELEEVKDKFEEEFTSEALISGVKAIIEQYETLLPEEIYKRISSSEDWKGIMSKMTNEELRDDIEDTLMKAIDEIQSGTEQSPEILKVLRLILQAVMSGKDVEGLDMGGI